MFLSFDERIVDFPVRPVEEPHRTLPMHNNVNERAAPVRDVAHATPTPEIDVPIHNSVGQERIPTCLNPVEIPSRAPC